MTTEWTVVIGLICTIIGVVIGIMGHRRNADKDTAAAGKREGEVLVEIGYIKSGVDDIKRDYREQASKFSDLSERVTRNEERTDQALARIESLESKRRPRAEA